MKKMIKQLCLIVILTAGGLHANAIGIDQLLSLGIELPKDPLTIEALIDLHKEQINFTKFQMEKMAVVEVQQSELTRKMKKVDAVKDTLENRVIGAYNWLKFGYNLNKMRLNIQTIYELDKELNDTIKSWTFRLPVIEGGLSLNAIKTDYRNIRRQTLILYYAYFAKKKAMTELTALCKIFIVQFGGDFASNALSGALKNLVHNLATDTQRRDFVNRVFNKQDKIKNIYYDYLHRINLISQNLTNVDLIGTFLSMMDNKSFAEEIVETYTI